MQYDIYMTIGNAIRQSTGVTDALLADGGEHADLASTVAFALAKQKKQSPVQIARDLAADLAKNPALAGVKIEAKGPYLNFIFGNAYVSEVIREAVLPGYGNLPKKPVRVVLEHTSANPNGPLHVGHIRNSII
ncbi:MAG TPA: arginine--tRNA ligase, partial [Methanoregula sp.]|nr:arginine--tRNA ligase [Methanoregula sp.]